LPDPSFYLVAPNAPLDVSDIVGRAGDKEPAAPFTKRPPAVRFEDPTIAVAVSSDSAR